MKMLILTGAGISAESGLGTFRDKDGIWTKYPLEDLATPEGFARNPDFVHGFYNARRAQLETARPNAAHIALAELQMHAEALSNQVLIVTQNVDNLHEQAGSPPDGIIHMHGELSKSLCSACGDAYPCYQDLTMTMACRACGAIGRLRPDVVWFGEMPYRMEEIEHALVASDVFVSIGTSGDVYPAAGFVHMAYELGKHTVELNLEPSSNANMFAETHYGKASEIVPTWTSKLLNARSN